MKRLQRAFEGEFSIVRRTLGYRFTILLVAALMVLLPLLYLALLGGVGWFVYWYGTTHTDFLKVRGGGWPAAFGYFAPLIAGVTLLSFLIKPLFAGPGGRDPGLKLSIADAPLLFALVARVAELMRAPEPKTIVLDCEVNAAASFGSGFGALFGRQLTLRLGLPLLEGFDVQALAGVVAHELGHFTQGAGMRLTYVVQVINGWFYRAVYLRDSWDQALAEWCGETGRGASILSLGVAWLAAAGVFISRCVLWVFFMLAHAISCFMLRHMEYDADRHAARLIGWEAYQKALRRMEVLGAGGKAANDFLNSCVKKDRYPDDLGKLAVLQAEMLTKKTQTRIQRRAAEARTRLFDTHPSLKDRVDRISQEEPPGVFFHDEPATSLVHNYPKMAIQVTRQFYRTVYRWHFEGATMVSVEILFGSEGIA